MERTKWLGPQWWGTTASLHGISFCTGRNCRWDDQACASYTYNGLQTVVCPILRCSNLYTLFEACTIDTAGLEKGLNSEAAWLRMPDWLVQNRYRLVIQW